MYKLVGIYSLVLLSCHIYTSTVTSSALIKNNYIGISEEEADRFYKQENYKPALLKYKAILEKRLTINKRSEVIIKIGKCYEKLSEYGAVLEYYHKFLEMYQLLDNPLTYSNIDRLVDQSPEEIAQLERWLDTKTVVDTTCKKIINRLGEEIWIESEEGKGSTFFFSLPNYHSN